MVFVGLVLSSAFPLAQVSGSGGGKVDIVNSVPNTMSVAEIIINDSAPNARFVADPANYTVPSYYKLTGMGGNDTFYLFGGFNNSVFVVTGGLNNTFDILTGNGTNSYSLVSGAHSSFNIVQDNPSNDSGTLAFAITSGVDSHVNATLANPFGTNTGGPAYMLYNAPYMLNTTSVGLTFYSIIVGTGSTVNLGSILNGNETVANVVA